MARARLSTLWVLKDYGRYQAQHMSLGLVSQTHCSAEGADARCRVRGLPLLAPGDDGKMRTTCHSYPGVQTGWLRSTGQDGATWVSGANGSRGGVQFLHRPIAGAGKAEAHGGKRSECSRESGARPWRFRAEERRVPGGWFTLACPP